MILVLMAQATLLCFRAVFSQNSGYFSLALRASTAFFASAREPFSTSGWNVLQGLTLSFLIYALNKCLYLRNVLQHVHLQLISLHGLLLIGKVKLVLAVWFVLRLVKRLHVRVL